MRNVVRVDAQTEQEAAEIVIADCKHQYGEDACWLIGYPQIIYLHSVAERDLSISTYWKQQPVDQEAIRAALRQQR